MAYSKLHDQDHPIIAKTGLVANINATATKNQATEGEIFYTTDGDVFYVYDGALNRPIVGQIPVITKSGNYTMTNDDYAVDVTTGASNVTITLPAGSTSKSFVIGKADSGAGSVIIDGDSAETINGSATFTILYQHSVVQLYWNGSEWRVK